MKSEGCEGRPGTAPPESAPCLVRASRRAGVIIALRSPGPFFPELRSKPLFSSGCSFSLCMKIKRTSQHGQRHERKSTALTTTRRRGPSPREPRPQTRAPPKRPCSPSDADRRTACLIFPYSFQKSNCALQHRPHQR